VSALHLISIMTLLWLYLIKLTKCLLVDSFKGVLCITLISPIHPESLHCWRLLAL
jgi:hypothetical protein